MTRPGQLPVYLELPDLVSGYEQDRYEIKFVRPMAATNLFANPSFETNTTGVNTSSSSVSRITTNQRRGIYGLQVTPTAAINAGIYMEAACTAGVLYYFSADVWGAAGVSYRLVVTTTGGSTFEETTKNIVGKNVWERPFTIFRPTSSATYRFFLQKDPSAGSGSTAVFVTDGWQLESNRLTTYLDGSLRGFVQNQTAYYWSGAEHASQSNRIATTRSGGEEVDLKDLGFSVRAILGLGADNFMNLSVDNAFLGGATYERSIRASSKFDIVGAFHGNLAEIMRNRSDLREILTYDAGIAHQPLVMKIRVKNECDDYISEPMVVRCLFSGGLLGVRDNYHQERVSLSFDIYDPYTGSLDGSIGSSIAFSSTITAAYTVARIGGVWQTLGSGMNGAVYALAYDPQRNRVYYGGSFTTGNGVTLNGIGYFDGSNFVAMGTGTSNGGPAGEVYTIAIAPNGDVWIGGLFNTVGGSATAGLGRWNIATSTWTAFNVTGVTFNRAIAIDSTGIVYIGGAFINFNGIADADYIVKYSGGSFSAVGGPANSDVVALIVNSNDILYAGGSFTTISGLSANRAAAYNPVTNTWSRLSPGAGFDNTVWYFALSPSGELFAGGDFTSVAADTAVRYVASQIPVQDVVPWRALGSGVNNIVRHLHFRNGLLYVAGSFTTAGGLVLSDSIAVWGGSSWNGLDIDLPAGIIQIESITDTAGNLYVGFDQTGTARTSTVVVNNVGSGNTYPRITITGPGQVQQIRNATTGASLDFSLLLNAGETAVLDLTPTRISFSSNFRPNLLGTILPGSNYDFFLAPGNNTLSTLMTGTDGNTLATLDAQPLYSSLDDTLYRPA